METVYKDPTGRKHSGLCLQVALIAGCGRYRQGEDCYSNAALSTGLSRVLTRRFWIA